MDHPNLDNARLMQMHNLKMKNLSISSQAGTTQLSSKDLSLEMKPEAYPSDSYHYPQYNAASTSFSLKEGSSAGINKSEMQMKYPFLQPGFQQPNPIHSFNYQSGRWPAPMGRIIETELEQQLPGSLKNREQVIQLNSIDSKKTHLNKVINHPNKISKQNGQNSSSSISTSVLNSTPLSEEVVEELIPPPPPYSQTHLYNNGYGYYPSSASQSSVQQFPYNFQLQNSSFDQFKPISLSNNNHRLHYLNDNQQSKGLLIRDIYSKIQNNQSGQQQLIPSEISNQYYPQQLNSSDQSNQIDYYQKYPSKLDIQKDIHNKTNQLSRLLEGPHSNQHFLNQAQHSSQSNSSNKEQNQLSSSKPLNSQSNENDEEGKKSNPEKQLSTQQNAMEIEERRSGEGVEVPLEPLNLSEIMKVPIYQEQQLQQKINTSIIQQPLQVVIQEYSELKSQLMNLEYLYNLSQKIREEQLTLLINSKNDLYQQERICYELQQIIKQCIALPKDIYDLKTQITVHEAEIKVLEQMGKRMKMKQQSLEQQDNLHLPNRVEYLRRIQDNGNSSEQANNNTTVKEEYDNSKPILSPSSANVEGKDSKQIEQNQLSKNVALNQNLNNNKDKANTLLDDRNQVNLLTEPQMSLKERVNETLQKGDQPISDALTEKNNKITSSIQEVSQNINQDPQIIIKKESEQINSPESKQYKSTDYEHQEEMDQNYYRYSQQAAGQHPFYPLQQPNTQYWNKGNYEEKLVREYSHQQRPFIPFSQYKNPIIQKPQAHYLPPPYNYQQLPQNQEKHFQQYLRSQASMTIDQGNTIVIKQESEKINQASTEQSHSLSQSESLRKLKDTNLDKVKLKALQAQQRGELQNSQNEVIDKDGDTEEENDEDEMDLDEENQENEDEDENEQQEEEDGDGDGDEEEDDEEIEVEVEEVEIEDGSSEKPNEMNGNEIKEEDDRQRKQQMYGLPSQRQYLTNPLKLTQKMNKQIQKEMKIKKQSDVKDLIRFRKIVQTKNNVAKKNQDITMKDLQKRMQFHNHLKIFMLQLSKYITQQIETDSILYQYDFNKIQQHKKYLLAFKNRFTKSDLSHFLKEIDTINKDEIAFNLEEVNEKHKLMKQRKITYIVTIIRSFLDEESMNQIIPSNHPRFSEFFKQNSTYLSEYLIQNEDKIGLINEQIGNINQFNKINRIVLQKFCLFNIALIACKKKANKLDQLYCKNYILTMLKDPSHIE